MIPAPVMHILVTLSMLFSLSLEPVKPWEPDPSEVTALAKTLYGECRGAASCNNGPWPGPSSTAWTVTSFRIR